MIRCQQFDFRFMTTLSYVYSNGMHIIFSQTQWCMRSNATRAMHFGCMYVIVEIAVEGFQSAKTQLEAVGFLSNMKQLEFLMLGSSTLTIQCNTLSIRSTKSTIGF